MIIDMDDLGARTECHHSGWDSPPPLVEQYLEEIGTGEVCGSGFVGVGATVVALYFSV